MEKAMTGLEHAGALTVDLETVGGESRMFHIQPGAAFGQEGRKAKAAKAAHIGHVVALTTQKGCCRVNQ